MELLLFVLILTSCIGGDIYSKEKDKTTLFCFGFCCGITVAMTVYCIMQ